MYNLDQLFRLFEKTRPAESLFSISKYGFEWAMEDGVIFYPEGYMSKSRAELLHCILPDIPICICGDFKSNNQKSEHLESAISKYPHALLVLSGDSEWVARTIPLLAKKIPTEMLGRVITHRQLGDFLPYGTKKTRYWDVARKSILPVGDKVKGKIAAAYSLFDDSLSQATFLAILRRYLFSSDSIVPYMDPSSQYFADEYIHLENEVFIDCGGYTGDTLEQYLKIKNESQFDEYIIFEPDKINFNILTNYVSSLPLYVNKKITVYPYAVGKENEILKFSGGEGSNSYISPDGQEEIKCVVMDEILFEKKPTFIKMDLQGHEAYALYGAKNIIEKFHPVLAISVYHYVHDLWELPLMMKHMYQGYSFFLRAYKHEEEYICYAIPDDRLYR